MCFNRIPITIQHDNKYPSLPDGASSTNDSNTTVAPPSGGTSRHIYVLILPVVCVMVGMAALGVASVLIPRSSVSQRFITFTIRVCGQIIFHACVFVCVGVCVRWVVGWVGGWVVVGGCVFLCFCLYVQVTYFESLEIQTVILNVKIHLQNFRPNLSTTVSGSRSRSTE